MTITRAATNADKLRGGYYTPASIARFCARWAVSDLPTPAPHVLEPSAGDGAFVAAIKEARPSSTVAALELLEPEAKKISQMEHDGVDVTVGDAFNWRLTHNSERFDAVVGNPPFIRYQSFPEAHRQAAFQIMQKAGLHPTRLTNAWVPFVVLATESLASNGRLAMVLPAELMQVSYAAELRSYLATHYSELHVVTFRSLIFAGIQQETVLLLGIRSPTTTAATMNMVQFDSEYDLDIVDVPHNQGTTADLDHATEKWTQYYLSSQQLGLVRELSKSQLLVPLGELANVNVGVVTGRNEFFVLSPERATQLGVARECMPLVGRSNQIPGVTFTRHEWEQLLAADEKCLLMQLGKTRYDELSIDARMYIRAGEAAGFHDGYKLKIRLPEWWWVPSTRVPDGFMLRQIHEGPRIISNSSGATSTDTIHRVFLRPHVDGASLASSSINSVTWALAEVRGRSYGGGVLELEPTEAEELLVPAHRAAVPVDEVDDLVRQRRWEDVMDLVDATTLISQGLTRSDCLSLRAAWRELSARRIHRKRRAPEPTIV